jgi:hypothetical protein
VFAIDAPDVFKSPASDTYVIFGEAKVEDLAAKAAQAMAQNFRAPAGAGAADAAEASAAGAAGAFCFALGGLVGRLIFSATQWANRNANAINAMCSQPQHQL